MAEKSKEEQPELQPTHMQPSVSSTHEANNGLQDDGLTKVSDVSNSLIKSSESAQLQSDGKNLFSFNDVSCSFPSHDEPIFQSEICVREVSEDTDDTTVLISPLKYTDPMPTLNDVR